MRQAVPGAAVSGPPASGNAAQRVFSEHPSVCLLSNTFLAMRKSWPGLSAMMRHKLESWSIEEQAAPLLEVCGTIQILFCCPGAVRHRRGRAVSNLLDEKRDFAVDQGGPVPGYVVAAAFGDDPAAAGGQSFKLFLALLPKRDHFRLQFWRKAGMREALRVVRKNQDRQIAIRPGVDDFIIGLSAVLVLVPHRVDRFPARILHPHSFEMFVDPLLDIRALAHHPFDSESGQSQIEVVLIRRML